MKRFFLFAIIIFLIAGCARVKVEKITHQNPYQEGIRFYRPHPYLWVTTNKDGDLQGAICWLPDKKEEYMIRVKSGIGKVETKVTIENGWNLTQFGETRDSQAPEMINALTGTLKDLTGIFDTKKLQKEILYPGLYAFIFDEETGLIKDLIPVVQFK